MKLCPYCAEEIQDAAVCCKHCRRDLVPATARGVAPAPGPRVPPPLRWFSLGLLTAAVLALAGPVVARPVLRQMAAARCEPANIVEWHAAMKQRCLKPSYVCEHMTTPKMLQDPDVARSFSPHGADDPSLAEMVGRMRSAFGCAPESGPAFRTAPPSDPTPWSPAPQDQPRAL